MLLEEAQGKGIPCSVLVYLLRSGLQLRGQGQDLLHPPVQSLLSLNSLMVTHLGHGGEGNVGS